MNHCKQIKKKCEYNKNTKKKRLSAFIIPGQHFGQENSSSLTEKKDLSVSIKNANIKRKIRPQVAAKSKETYKESGLSINSIVSVNCNSNFVTVIGVKMVRARDRREAFEKTLLKTLQYSSSSLISNWKRAHFEEVVL